MKLNILISTYNDGIEQVRNVLLDYRDDVTYIVTHQYTDSVYKYIPEELKREDIFVYQIEGKGVTKSRNKAIKLANGEIGLFSDDDVTYTNQYIDTVINYFKRDDSLDVALFKIKTPEGYPEYKKYPQTALKLKTLPFDVGTIEISFRVKSIKSSNVLFDERFGAGQEKLIGADESIFISDCLKKGNECLVFSRIYS